MKSFWSAIAVVLLLGGCTVNREVNLVLADPGPRMTRGGADQVAIKVSASDVNGNLKTLGTAWNNFTGVKYSLVAGQPVEAVVAKGVEAEFRGRGFRLGDGPPYLLVDVVLASTQMNTNAHCELAARVLDAGGQVLHAKSYSHKYSRMLTTFNSAEEGVEKLQELRALAIQDMAEDGQLTRALFEASLRR